MQTKKSEIWVGAFMLISLCSTIFICLQAANIKWISNKPTYRIYATFDNIGELKVQSPVKIGGVVIGRISEIELDIKTYTPRVTLEIQGKYNKIPDTSSLSIRTAGLLGEQYLAFNLGFEDPMIGTTLLKNGETVQDTKSAIVLEDLIGQLLYKSSCTQRSDLTTNTATPPLMSTSP
ncbi:outer membrane lipid asymmetry maintenance protein MlaD [Candidatus Gillettellia adelgis]